MDVRGSEVLLWLRRERPVHQSDTACGHIHEFAVCANGRVVDRIVSSGSARKPDEGWVACGTRVQTAPEALKRFRDFYAQQGYKEVQSDLSTLIPSCLTSGGYRSPAFKNASNSSGETRDELHAQGHARYCQTRTHTTKAARTVAMTFAVYIVPRRVNVS